MSRRLGWALLGVLLLALILVPFALGEGAMFALSERWLAAAASRSWLALVIVVLLASDVFLPIPSSFVAAGAVAALGAVSGGAVVWLGMSAGASIGYALGRFGGMPLARRVVGAAELERAARLHARFGAAVLIVCRGVPVLAEASSVLAGALGMRLLTFVFVTSAANLGLAVAYAWLGALGSGLTAALLPFALGIGVPALALWMVKRLDPKRRANDV
jgi:uncharacterized membrane protein YdjX (TVP38/TMEM64 family)